MLTDQLLEACAARNIQVAIFFHPDLHNHSVQLTYYASATDKVFVERRGAQAINLLFNDAFVAISRLAPGIPQVLLTQVIGDFIPDPDHCPF